jgi:predicted ATPase
MSTPRIRANNFRVLQTLDWPLDGLCLLAGANGAGKSTVLDLLRFLRAFFFRGREEAFLTIGGSHLRSLFAEPDEPVVVELAVDDVRWELRFPMTNRGITGSYGERLVHGEDVIVRAEMFSEEQRIEGRIVPRDELSCGARMFWHRNETNPDWMFRLYQVLQGIRVYGSFWLNQVRQPSRQEMPNHFLHGTGRNLWAVLENWQNAPRMYHDQYRWVMDGIARAFPGLLDSIEFNRGDAYLFQRGATDPADGLPPNRAADGLLTGLLQLTAVAGAQSGSIIAFDEMENQLHPHAIRVILNAMRERAESEDLKIVITTHSPVVMNAFREEPEQFFVLESQHPRQPIALDELHDPDWLAAFELGDLYDRREFGARPPVPASD